MFIDPSSVLTQEDKNNPCYNMLVNKLLLNFRSQMYFRDHVASL